MHRVVAFKRLKTMENYKSTISPKRRLEKKVVVFHLQGVHWGNFIV